MVEKNDNDDVLICDFKNRVGFGSIFSNFSCTKVLMKLAFLALLFQVFYLSSACTSHDNYGSDYATTIGLGCILHQRSINLYKSYSVSGSISSTNDSRILIQNFQISVDSDVQNFQLRLFARSVSYVSAQKTTTIYTHSKICPVILASGKYVGLGDPLLTFAGTTNGSLNFSTKKMVLQPTQPMHIFAEFLVVIIQQSGEFLNAQPIAFQKFHVTNVSGIFTTKLFVPALGDDNNNDSSSESWYFSLVLIAFFGMIASIFARSRFRLRYGSLLPIKSTHSSRSSFENPPMYERY